MNANMPRKNLAYCGRKFLKALTSRLAEVLKSGAAYSR
jgi:hypothetical protein